MNALVTNARTRMAHLCAKSLFQKGHSVYLGDHSDNSYLFPSRYIKGSFTYPSPYADQEGFIDSIIKFLQAHQPVFLLPTYEETFLFAKHYEKIAPYCHCAIPPYASILQVHNKWSLYQIATALNVKTPFTVPLNDYINAGKASPPIDYPFVIKPRQGGGNWQIYFVKKESEYIEALDKIRAAKIEHRMLIQEFIPTDRKYSHAVVFKSGIQTAYFTDLHIRDYPSSGGAGCCRISIKDPIIEAMGKKLFEHLRWNGVAEMEVVRHNITGDYYMIEVNPRIWGGINSALLSGLNIPQILFEIASNNSSNIKNDYKTDIETRWLWGELRAMHGNITLSQNSLWEFMDILRGLFHLNRYDEIDIADSQVMFSLILSQIPGKQKKRISGIDSLQGEWD